MKHAITFAGITAQPGEKVTGNIDFPGSSYPIPVALFNGNEDGKIFLLTASIHGFEYTGIQAAVEMIRELDPSSLSGAVGWDGSASD